MLQGQRRLGVMGLCFAGELGFHTGGVGSPGKIISRAMDVLEMFFRKMVWRQGGWSRGY